jgi:hypothetical protein
MSKYRLLSGPFIGYTVDDGGNWLKRLGCETPEEADEDLCRRFVDWLVDNKGSLVTDLWMDWLNTWESEEIDEEE